MTTKFHLPRASFASSLRRALSFLLGAPALLILLGLAANPAAQAQITDPIIVGAQSSVYGVYPTHWTNPIGVATDSYGNVYVGQCASPEIIKSDPGGHHSTVYINSSQLIGVAPAISQALGCVGMLAMDSSNNLYIADTNNSRIIEWNTDTNELVAVYRTGVIFPLAVTLDPSGNIWYGGTNTSYTGQVGYIPEGSPNNTIGTIDTNITNLGTNNTSPQSPELAVSDTVSGLAFVCAKFSLLTASRCDLFVSDIYNNGVYDYARQTGAFSITTTYESAHESTFASNNGPFSIYVEPNNNILIAESLANTVVEYRATVFLGVTTWSTADPISPYLVDATGIAVDQSTTDQNYGDIYITSAASIIEVAGGGVAPEGSPLNGPGAVTLINPNWDFGTLDIGHTSDVVTVDVLVPGGPLNHLEFGSFPVFDQGTTGSEYNLAPNALNLSDYPYACQTGVDYTSPIACQIELVFQPKYPGARPGELDILGLSSDVLTSGFIHGTGRGPEIQFNPGATVDLYGSGLAAPAGIATDSVGDLFIANSVVHSIVEISDNGSTENTIITGLNEPTGVAIDGSGDLFVADYAAGAVYEYKWNGTSFGSRATVATVTDPEDVAVDKYGNVFITETTNGEVVEAAWTGNHGLFGAGSGYSSPTVIESGLNGPWAIAVDGSDNLFITTLGDLEVREIAWNGLSYTLESAPLGGDWTLPYGIAVDANSDVYVSDLGHRGVVMIPYYHGSYTSEPGDLLATDRTFDVDEPTGVAVGPLGNVYLADLGLGTVEKLDLADPPTLYWHHDTYVGVPDWADNPQHFSIANIGNEALGILDPVADANPYITPASFYYSGDSSCPSVTTTSAWEDPGLRCTYDVDFLPLTVGTITGTLTLYDDNLHVWDTHQIVPLNGDGLQNTPRVWISSSVNPVFIQTTPVTFTAHVDGPHDGTIPPTGNVYFYDGATLLGHTALTTCGSECAYSTATWTVTDFTTAGPHDITAKYIAATVLGPYHSPETSDTYVENAQDFTIAIVGANSASIFPGGNTNFAVVLTPTVETTFPLDVVLSSTGEPTGAGITWTFTPPKAAAGASTTTSVFAISVPNTVIASNDSKENLGRKLAPLSLALLLLPIFGFRRGRKTWQRYLALLVLIGGSLAVAAGLSACSAASGYFGQNPISPTLTVTGTATGPSGTLIHSTSVTLNIQ